MHSKHKKSILVLCLILLPLIVFYIALNPKISYSHYIIEAADFPYKIAFISDIHNKVFPNDELVKGIQAEQPDFILIPGDIINFYEDETDIATRLISHLSEIAPVYCSMGNHELEYQERTGMNIKQLFSEAGAVVLDKEYLDIEINGEAIRIGGIYGYCLPERFENHDPSKVEFLREFGDTDNYRILLSHLPYPWVYYGFSEDYFVDLVLTGHSHGGQVRVPFMGGLYDPEIGWFPGKCAGIHEEGNTLTIQSRGIGSGNEKFPRLNNPPEIVIIEMKSTSPKKVHNNEP